MDVSAFIASPAARFGLGASLFWWSLLPLLPASPAALVAQTPRRMVLPDVRGAEGIAMAQRRSIEHAGMPANTEAERYVLGSILLDDSGNGAVFEAVAADLTPADFSIEKHRRIFQGMTELHRQGVAIDDLTLQSELDKRGHLQAVGGVTYLVELSAGLPRLANLRSHTEAVRSYAARRRLIELGNNIISQAAEPTAEPEAISAGLLQELGRLSRSSRNGHGAERQFELLSDGRYRLTAPDIGTVIEADRLRRDRQELIGELAVRCQLPGARTFEGVLSIADFNLSSARARIDRAKLLAARSQAAEIDWQGLLEEFVQRVLAEERNGRPAVDLRELPEPELDEIQVKGFSFPRSHPTIIFGDGGAAKSYTALYLAGRLAQAGMTVALFDWELSGEDHRYRLRLLFGDTMPRILYVRCERPLVAEADRLRRIVRESGIGYSIFDSVAFACDGPPKAAEVAGRYFRAVREIGIGSCHIAHVNKSLDNDKRPFGSAFWHNGARSTWFVKAAEAQGNESTLDIGFYNRKANLGPIKPPLGFTVTFTPERTTFRHSAPGDTPDLAVKMTVTQRIAHLLKGGPRDMGQIADELEIPRNTVSKTVLRKANKGQVFIVLENKRVGLLDKRTTVP